MTQKKNSNKLKINFEILVSFLEQQILYCFGWLHDFKNWIKSHIVRVREKM